MRHNNFQTVIESNVPAFPVKPVPIFRGGSFAIERIKPFFHLKKFLELIETKKNTIFSRIF
jgi:hypothetical protein